MSHALTFGETPTSDDKTWGLISHLSGFALPYGIGPILLYVVFKDKAPFVKYHAMQAFVFHLVAWIIGSLTCGLGLILLFLPLWVAYQAYLGEWKGYPLIEGVGRE